MWFTSQFCSYSGNWVWNKFPYFLYFGKEYAHISFPFQIMFADQSLTTARSIQIMLLLHQLMRYKESLLFLLVGSTIQRMIMEFMISSKIPSSRSSSVSSLKWRWRYVEDIFQILCLVLLLSHKNTTFCSSFLYHLSPYSYLILP